MNLARTRENGNEAASALDRPHCIRRLSLVTITRTKRRITIISFTAKFGRNNGEYVQKRANVYER